MPWFGDRRRADRARPRGRHRRRDASRAELTCTRRRGGSGPRASSRSRAGHPRPAVLGVLGAATLVLAGLGRRPEAPPFTGYLLLGRRHRRGPGGVPRAGRASSPGGRVLLDLPVLAPAVGARRRPARPGHHDGPGRGRASAGCAGRHGARHRRRGHRVGARPAAARRCRAALHHVATALVIAVGVAPSLVRAIGAARRARRLRGLPERGPRRAGPVGAAGARRRPGPRPGPRGVDGRAGYARLHRGTTAGWPRCCSPRCSRPWSARTACSPGHSAYALPVVGAAVCSSRGWAAPCRRAGRRRTRYRHDPWAGREWLVAGSGAVVLLGAVAGGSPAPLLAGAVVARARCPGARAGSRGGGGVIRLEHVSVTYPGCDVARPCATSTSRSPRASCAWWSGPTGAGKSTLLRAVSGLVPHFTGGTAGRAGAGRRARHPRPTARATSPTSSAWCSRTRRAGSSPRRSRTSWPTRWSSSACRRPPCAPGWRRCSTCSAWRTCAAPRCATCPAASSSGSRSAPCSPRTRASWCSTSRPPRSTRPPPTTCSRR